jgi:hypothetical protein
MVTAQEIATAVIYNVIIVLLLVQSIVETATVKPGCRTTATVPAHIIVLLLIPVTTVTVPATVARLFVPSYTTLA